MLIAVDTRFLFSQENVLYHDFSEKVLLPLALQKTGHKFIFLTDKKNGLNVSLPNNVSVISITPAPKNFFTYKWWYNVRLPLLFRKNKIDIFLASYGLCSTCTNVPQLLVMHDLAFFYKNIIHPPHSMLFYKRSTADSLTKAAAVTSLLASVKTELVNKYHLPEAKITVCGGGYNGNYKKADWKIKEAAKAQYAGGCEYFICRLHGDSASRFVQVLKAFSIFKKWQRSNMKLLIAGQAMAQNEQKKLDTYKFKSDVILLPDHLPQAEMIVLAAAAYAAIHPVLYDGFSSAMLEYMNAGVPIIAFNTPVANEMAGSAALYAYTNEQSLAEQMKVIYKDENLRGQIIVKGIAKAKEYSWDKTRETIWNMIESILYQAH